MVKILGVSVAAVLLLSGCAGEVEKVTLPNGNVVKNVKYLISDDKENYLSEINLHYTKANIFTPRAVLQTSKESKTLNVTVHRHQSQARSVALYPFTLNSVKPISCKDIKSKNSKKEKMCTFDKNKVYTAYLKRGELIVDESGNGHSSASWECLKQYPKIEGRSFYDSAKWQTNMDTCIAKQYKMGSWSQTRGGTLESRLGYDQFAFTNKHYQIDVKDKEKFKQFLFGK